MKRARIKFADKEIEFIDREVALKHIEELAVKGTWIVHIVYGPEGCGKTTFLKQAKYILEDFGYHVIYTNPLAREEREIFTYTPTIHEIVEEVLKSLLDPYSKIVDIAIRIASRAMRKLIKPRIAVLMDDIFQAIGLDKAEIYTKILLNLIEYPSGDYEKIVVLVSSSEGVTRERIGRHRWADFYILWNMSREGFKQLYEVLPEPKPPFEDVWRIAGGNPDILEKLYRNKWNVESVIDGFIRSRKLEHFIASLGEKERGILMEAIEDPDIIFKRLRESEVQQLERRLIEMNLIMDVWERESQGWIDIPPPEKDLELGIGKYYAWQTPLHREAIRRILI